MARIRDHDRAVEYLESHPQGYRYSQFCELYRRWQGRLAPSMRQLHRPGEKVFVDFSGKRLHVVDRDTGELLAVELFVGVLGASSYLYAEAVASQSLPDWIAANTRMLEDFGGCPSILIPDNLKAAVTTPCRYEPLISRTYDDFAAHYGAVVIPARTANPKDKAKVESGVLLAQRWLLARLRHHTFFSLAELNQALDGLRVDFNQRAMRRLGVSRLVLFESLDRPALQPLPARRYELAQWKQVRVNIDHHVELEHNVYSVPYQLCGKGFSRDLRERTFVSVSATAGPIKLKIAGPCRTWAQLSQALLGCARTELDDKVNSNQ